MAKKKKGKSFYDKKHEAGEFSFWGSKRYLSNMFPCEIRLEESHLELFPDIDFKLGKYYSSENLYQGMKVADERVANYLYFSCSPRESKKYFEDNSPAMRDDWDNIKVSVMAMALFLKFSQNRDLYEELLSEDSSIEEVNFWGDTFWGIYEGKGGNRLGRMLMLIRDYGPSAVIEGVKKGLFWLTFIGGILPTEIFFLFNLVKNINNC